MTRTRIEICIRLSTISILWVLPLLTSGCGWLLPEEPAAPTSPPASPTQISTSTSAPAPTLESTPTMAPRPTSTLRPTSTPTPTPATPPTPSLAELAAQYPELAAILNNPELHTVYKEVLAVYQQEGEQAAMELAQQYGLLTPEGDIRATLVLDTLGTEGTAALVAQLEAAGITVVSAEGDQIEVAVPMELIQAQAGQPGAILTQLTQLEHVIGMRPPW